MNRALIRFSQITAVLALLTTQLHAEEPGLGIEQNEPPAIAHVPTGAGYFGYPIPITAKVTDATGKLTEVSVFYALSKETTPVKLRMKRIKGNVYKGLIPAGFFATASEVWYYVEARDSFDDTAETLWHPVIIKQPDADHQQEEPPEEAPSTEQTPPDTGDPVPPDTEVAKPGINKVVLIGGGVLLVGGGIALAGGGGGGGGSSGGGGGGVTIADALADTPPGGPTIVDRVMDATAAVAGKTVTSVNVSLNFNPVAFSDEFQIIYEGGLIGSSGLTGAAGSISASSAGSAPTVIIRVREGLVGIPIGNDWSWSATATFTVVP